MVLVSTALLPVLVGYVLSALAMLFLTVYTVREMEATPTMRSFAFMLGMVTLWSWAFAGRLVAVELQTKLLFHYIAYVAIAFTPVTWLFFALYYTGSGRYVTRGRILAVSLPATATLVLVVTNYRDMYYSSIEMTTLYGTALVDLSAGPLFWAAAFYSYLLIVAGLAVLVRFAVTSEDLYRLQSASLITAAVLPLLLNAAFLAGLSPVPNVDFTPITFALSGLLIAVAVFYGQFVAVLPVARDTIIETLDDSIVVADDGGQVVYANPAAKSVLTADDEELLGLDAETTFPWTVPEESTVQEVSTETAEGKEWYLFRQVPFERGSEASGTIHIFTEITQRKQLEEKLRALQRTGQDLMVAESYADIGDIVVSTARDILDLPVTGLWRYDDEADQLDPVAITPEGADLVGEPPTFTPGNSLAWQTFDDGALRVFNDVSDYPETYNEESPITSEVQVPVGDQGLIVSGSTEYREFEDINFELLRILSAATEQAFVRAERELQLRERERELARENERLEEFTSVVAHDLRSPLNSADIFLEKLAAEYDDPRLEQVRSAHDRTKQLVDDLLALARQGKTVDEHESVSIETVARRAWESVPTGEATLDVTDGCGTVLADESRLRQVFENLFGNSVEHGSTGNRTQSGDSVEHGDDGVTVRVGQLEESGFYVADDGPGIPADARSQVFDHGYTQSADGTGFGLAIVRRIAEAHGWSVEATDSVDGGLRIEFRGVDAPDEES